MKCPQTTQEVNVLKNDYTDRISNLPDSILEHILSYLNTKYAVATSILSTKWKHLIPFGVSPIHLDLDDSLTYNPVENQSNSPSITFTSFVDKLLNEHQCDIRLLDLNCYKDYGDAKIVSWVLACIRRNVQHLILTFFLRNSDDLFRSLSGCKTLVELDLAHLAHHFDLYIPNDFNLPNLDRLCLYGFTFHDEQRSINELIEGCPSLKSLSLVGCNTYDLTLLRIRSHVLEVLHIVGCWTESRCELFVDAPNLRFLVYDDFPAPEYGLTEFKSLHSVHINVGRSSEQMQYEGYESLDEGVAKIFKACSSTVKLYLTACTIEAIQRTHVQVPTFQNLTSLSLGLLGIEGRKLFACLLSNAPNLESFQLVAGFDESDGEFASFESFLPNLPSCVELKLKKIELCVFEGKEDEKKFIEYFLKNAKVLEEVHVRCLPYEDVLMFPRQSKTCRVFFQAQ